jgi:hypothetical protein
VELDRLLIAPDLMDTMRRAATQLGRPDALSAVVAVVEEQAEAQREGMRIFRKALNHRAPK